MSTEARKSALSMSARHVIFDMDGVLLDSEPIYMKVEGDLVRELNPDADLYTILHKILGRTGPYTARLILETFNIDMTVEDYIQLRRSRLAPAMQEAAILPGVERLVRWLSENNVRMAVATSSPRDLFEAKKVGKERFFDMFEAIICGDDVKNGKPDPEIFLAAANALGVEPSDCVVFEDAPSGIKGAKAAGMLCVALPNPDVDSALYSDANPDLMFPSMREFSPEMIGLPAYRKTE